MLTKLLLATTNKGKMAEYRHYFSKVAPGLKLVGLDQLDVKGKAVEDGKTFAENALKKARFYANQTRMTTLADDGGLEINALGGEPGVKSRRWPGHEATDEELVRMVITKLQGVPPKRRGGQLRAVAVVVKPGGEVLARAEGTVQGIIPAKPDTWIEPHLPFRAVLWIEKFGNYYQNLTDSDQEKINHRRKMIRELAKQLKLGPER